jgi:hypothetical protein
MAVRCGYELCFRARNDSAELLRSPSPNLSASPSLYNTFGLDDNGSAPISGADPLFRSRPIDRMPWIERPTVDSDVGSEAIRLFLSLPPVVAIEAKRLQRCSHERMPITTMGYHMICNGSDHCLTFC